MRLLGQSINLLISFFILKACITPNKNSEKSEAAIIQNQLENGLDVILYPSSKVPLVTIVLAVKAGAFTETPETNGLTHLWEHMFFKGNSQLPNQEAFNERIRELGIVYNGDTSAEKVRYYFTLPSAYLEEGLEFMYHAISSPLLEKEEINREIKVVMDEYDRNASQPGFELNRVRRLYLYRDQAYLRDPLGERFIIAKADREKLLKMKEEVFVPKNSAILVSGDFDPSKTQSLINKYFKNWSNPENWNPPKVNQFPPFPKSGRLIASHPQNQNPYLGFTFQGPKVTQNPKDTFAADVLHELLALRSGKFYQKYIESGLSYGASLSYFTQSQSGEITLYASPKPDNLIKVEKMLIEEPKIWLESDYFSENQLEDVKRSLLISHKYEVNKPSEYIKNLAFWWSITGMNYYQNYLDELQKVTLDDIHSFIKKYLLEQPYVTSILLSPQDSQKLGLKPNLDEIQKQLKLMTKGEKLK